MGHDAVRGGVGLATGEGERTRAHAVDGEGIDERHGGGDIEEGIVGAHLVHVAMGSRAVNGLLPAKKAYQRRFAKPPGPRGKGEGAKAGVHLFLAPPLAVLAGHRDAQGVDAAAARPFQGEGQAQRLCHIPHDVLATRPEVK